MIRESEEGGPRNRMRSPSLATFLSFLLPGLGQWYLGRQRSALLYAVPILVVTVLAVTQVVGGIPQLAVDLFSPTYSLTILILIVLFGLWRLISMADAATAKGGWRSVGRRASGVLALLAVVVIAVHAVGAYYAWSFYSAGSRIFVADQGTEPSPSGSGSLGGDTLVATPFTTPATVASRINILLTGIDSSAGRTHALNDTLILASVDPTTKKVAMISFPRDLANLPLWHGGVFTGKINALMTYARQHPSEYPDGPLPSLIKELGYLAGAPIHYYAAVDLDGFRHLIDKVGGVDVNNPRQIDDPGYGGWTDGRRIGFSLSPGVHHLDGQTALAYVRSRKGFGDNDFTRSRRQQQLLVALARKLADPAMLPRLPDLLTVAGDTVRTNFPADRLREMMQITQGVKDDSINQVVLGPPYATTPVSPTRYILELDFRKVATLSKKIFGAESAYNGVADGSPPPTGR